MKIMAIVILILRFVFLGIGGAFIWYGTSLLNIPLSYIVLGVYCIVLAYPSKSKKGKVE